MVGGLGFGDWLVVLGHLGLRLRMGGCVWGLWVLILDLCGLVLGLC